MKKIFTTTICFIALTSLYSIESDDQGSSKEVKKDSLVQTISDSPEDGSTQTPETESEESEECSNTNET